MATSLDEHLSQAIVRTAQRLAAICLRAVLAWLWECAVSLPTPVAFLILSFLLANVFVAVVLTWRVARCVFALGRLYAKCLLLAMLVAAAAVYSEHFVSSV
ncbi:hypothetical protein F5B20DRAFT_585629 [Whalleya microplaca]|nr:hypothetical protein F5B20DRAFT_585629 [Whalleya microplaca]